VTTENENVYIEVSESAYKQNHVYRPWPKGSANKKAGDRDSFKDGKGSPKKSGACSLPS
jgi:hypothetical protein